MASSLRRRGTKGSPGPPGPSRTPRDAEHRHGNGSLSRGTVGDLPDADPTEASCGRSVDSEEGEDFDWKFEVAQTNLARLTELTALADGKVATVTQLHTAILAVLAIVLDRPTPVALVCAAVCAICVLLSFVSVAKANSPDIKSGLGSNLPANLKNNLMFFGTIGSTESASTFNRQWVKAPKSDLLFHLNSQVFTNSKIVTSKFKEIGLAYRLLWLAVPFWVASLAAHQIGY